MVNPIYIIAVLLGIGFILPLTEKKLSKLGPWVFYAGMIFTALVSYQWFRFFIVSGGETYHIFTAGVKPPLSINLQIGLFESVLLFVTNLTGLAGAVYMTKQISETGVRAMVLLLLLLLGLNGLILTRDIFNLFVFMEITAISTYSLIGMDVKSRSLSAGFKYMTAGGLASAFLLLGIIIVYSLTGTLNLDGMIRSAEGIKNVKLLSIGSMMILFSFIIEAKQFPANGWALDVYEGTKPGVAGLISGIGTTAVFFGFYKIMPLFTNETLKIVMWAGLITFFFSNLMGMKQENVKRMLGYSSVAQTGLVISVSAWSFMLGNDKLIFPMIVLPLLFNHFFTKTGLFWIAGLVKKDTTGLWGSITENKILHGIFIILILALSGFPPFPGFWGKWNLVLAMSLDSNFFYIWVLLAGSLFEAAYLLKWAGITLKKDKSKDILEYNSYKMLALQIVVLIFFAVTVYYFMTGNFDHTNGGLHFYLPFALGTGLLLLPFIPEKLKGMISMSVIAVYAFYFLPDQNGIGRFFNAMFLSGGFFLTFATLNRKDRSRSFYPLLMLMLGSLIALVNSDNILHFFFSWEIMTLSSYFLIHRGKGSAEESFRYVMFSLAGAFLMLLGFAYSFPNLNGQMSFGIFAVPGQFTSLSFILISIGFLVKSAALGLHLWIAGSYAKAEDDTSAFLSALLSKAGIFGFVMLLLAMGAPSAGKFDLAYILSWIGALTALIGTMMAIYEEDAKRLLAYSSMGQVGYIILGLAIMSGLGWTAALFQMVNHFLIKGILFLAIAGVIYRTGTSEMYKMGGLIKKMPWSFTAVMFGIIAISGVPPLTGFGAKWLMYEALIEKGWYLQTGMAFFASTVAFLYCFRLIHAIFLGQPKTEFRNVKEAPAWFLIPQYVFIMAIFFFSIFPRVLIDRISAAVEPFFGKSLTWDGNTVISSLGYWNATAVMTIVGVVFVVLAIGLFIKLPKVQKVKQFNIVFAAERPETPELTHFAYEFFRPYRRAMGWMVRPYATRFWRSVTESAYTVSDALRKIYTGNGQTYIFHILLVLVILFYISTGVK